MSCSCPPHPINRRAYVGSQVVRLRQRIPELEKLSRRTPPGHLREERARVERAKADLVEARALLEAYEAEHERLLAAERG